jgi:hypothetical protein
LRHVYIQFEKKEFYMKKILLVTIGLFVLILSACGAAAEATPVKLVSPTRVSAPPTVTPLPAAATDTALPSVVSPAPTEAPAATAQISFAKDVLPILDNYCAKCHGIDQIKEGLDLTSYSNLMQGSFNGPVITPGNAKESLLVDLVSKGKMPKRGDKPSAADLQVIINWVNAGALNN